MRVCISNEIRISLAYLKGGYGIGRIENNNIEKHIGEIRYNKNGTKMQIINFRSHDDLDIQFLDGYNYIKRHNTYSNFKAGGVKNPYDKTIANVGMIGYGKYLPSIKCNNTIEYNTWRDMIYRCYDKRKAKSFPAYYNICVVDKKWHNFQNFADWYNKNKYSVDGRLHLDKDILSLGCKIYSEETCLLVPQRINELFTVSTRKNDGLPQGIRKTKTGYSVQFCGKNLGLCKTYDEACNKYIVAKSEKIIEVANEYKDIVPTKIYDALMNYEVKIAA